MIEYKHDGMTVASLHDERTGSFQYVVVDDTTKTAAIIDPVLDFDPRAGATATRNADLILDYVREKGLTVEWVLDTHPHADHFSAVSYLAGKTGGKTAIGNKIVEVQKLWRDIYCLPDLAVDGSQWDRLFADGERFRIGTLDAQVMLSPGHTLASITYVVVTPRSFTTRLWSPIAAQAGQTSRVVMLMRCGARFAPSSICHPKPQPMSGMTMERMAGTYSVTRPSPISVATTSMFTMASTKPSSSQPARNATHRSHYPT